MPWCASCGDQSGSGGGGPWEGQYQWDLEDMYMSPSALQVDVIRGCGRYIPRAPYSEAVYSRILQRDLVWVPKAVDRAPYSGPVIGQQPVQ